MYNTTERRIGLIEDYEFVTKCDKGDRRIGIGCEDTCPFFNRIIKHDTDDIVIECNKELKPEKDKKEEMMKILIYFVNGNVYGSEVESAEKAREHAGNIFKTGYRVKTGNSHTWFGPHYVDKIVWKHDETYLAGKYKE